MNTRLHAVTDQNGRPLGFFMTAGQISDYTGTSTLLDSLPMAQWLLEDRGYDADWFRDALEEKGIRFCIPVWEEDPAENQSNTTGENTKDAAASKSCSAASRTGGGPQHAMTDARPSSSQPSVSLQPSFSGYES